MRLEDIGFYTLTNTRASNANAHSPLYRCELLLTDRCNFQCLYCRKTGIPDISLDDAKKVVNIWAQNNIRNIRFSGGEPTLWKDLIELVDFTAKIPSIERIAISTNGSADYELYQQLINAGVNDFSISLDSCCSEIANKMAGKPIDLHSVLQNIDMISQQVYTTIGVVITPDNIDGVIHIINMAMKTSISDIRLISAAQWNRQMIFEVPNINRFPILQYRIKNSINGRGVRGILSSDTNKCPLVLDDMAVMNGEHYPCIIYLREKGMPIGRLNNNVRKEREEWYKRFDSHSDPICKKNCLDVCIDYNNKYCELHND